MRTEAARNPGTNGVADRPRTTAGAAGGGQPASAARRRFMIERGFARDREHDGRFLTGVVTTGIYCLPSCPARRPLPENIRFFTTQNAAVRAGLRACLRCRPDRFYRDHDPEMARLIAVVDRLCQDPAGIPGVAALATAAGIGATKLPGLLRRHYHTTPAELLLRARVEAAARLLLESERPLPGIGIEAGFETPSVFDAEFHKLTGLTPRRYRRLGRQPEFAVDLPADFRPEECLRYLGRDPDSPTERVDGRTLRRAVRLDGRVALLTLTLRRDRAGCRVAAPRPISRRGMAEAHRIAWRLLGLAIDPGPFERRIVRRRLGRLVHRRPGLRIPQTADVYEGLVWAIIGQQINLRFALKLRRRLIERAGAERIDGLIAHPVPEAVARVDNRDLAGEQFSTRKAEYLIDTSRLIVSGDLAPETFPYRTATGVERSLLAVRGLGPWSAHYLMMRSCGFADCVPVGDSALATALESLHSLPGRPGPDETRRLMERYAPHRSLATFHLWRTLGDPA